MRDDYKLQCPVGLGQDPALVLDYLDGRLSTESTVRVQRHLDHCADCRRVVEAQRAVREALDLWSPAEISPDFNQRFFNRLEIEEQGRPGAWRALVAALSRAFTLRPLIPVAATCMLVLGVWMYERPVQPDTDARVEPASEQVDVEQVDRTLADMEMLQQLGVIGRAESGESKSL